MQKSRLAVERMTEAQLWTKAESLAYRVRSDLSGYPSLRAVAVDAWQLECVVAELRARGTQLQLPLTEATAGTR